MKIEPGKEEFLKLAGLGNLIPVTRRILADFETPLSAYQKIRGEGESFLCESVEGGERIGRYSFVGCNPRAVIRQTGGLVEVTENGKVTERYALPGVVDTGGAPATGRVRDGLEVVEQVMQRFHAVPRPGLRRFTGGAMGFIVPIYTIVIVLFFLFTILKV